MQSRKEEWRRRLAHLEKSHSRQFKKTRAGLKNPTETLAKLEKKLKKNKGDAEMAKLRETLVNELKVILWHFSPFNPLSQVKKKMFEEQERAAVREVAISTILCFNLIISQVACQERSHYTTFAACLKPLVTEEVAMLREVEQTSFNKLWQQAAKFPGGRTRAWRRPLPAAQALEEEEAPGQASGGSHD